MKEKTWQRFVNIKGGKADLLDIMPKIMRMHVINFNFIRCMKKL